VLILGIRLNPEVEFVNARYGYLEANITSMNEMDLILWCRILLSCFVNFGITAL
jgi:hypothetical protein